MALQTITVQELNQLLVQKEKLFLLDVRNEDDFKEWKIEGPGVVHLNIPYYQLIDEIDQVIGQLPSDRRKIVVCNQEGSAKLIAEKLAEKGVDISYLLGGMRAWSEYLYPVMAYQDENMKVYQFIRVGKGCLSYMVISGKEALVIDPVRFIDEFIAFADQEGVKITHIADTHIHADHISGGYELAQQLGAKYFVMKREGATFDFEALEDHPEINFEKVHLEVVVVKTPGHTPGSVSFFINNRLLFTGDTIFVSGLGRPDLGGKAKEWAQDLYDTIYSKVAQFADDVLVLPGHYSSFAEEVNDQGFIGSYLGEIRKTNEMMTGMSKEQFIEEVAKSASTVTPPNYLDILAINKGIKQVSPEEMLELEIGPNRCAVHHTS